MEYFEVDIEYVTGAKMVLRGESENNIRELIAKEFADVPQLKVLSIKIADEDLVNEAKARRAFEDAQSQVKETLN